MFSRAGHDEGSGVMAGNVLAWIAGYGRRLIPLTPYRCEQVPDDPRSLLIQHTGVWGTRSIVVTVPVDGAATIRRIAGTIITRGVVDVQTPEQRPDLNFGPPDENWRIESRRISENSPRRLLLNWVLRSRHFYSILRRTTSGIGPKQLIPRRLNGKSVTGQP